MEDTKQQLKAKIYKPEIQQQKQRLLMKQALEDPAKIHIQATKS